MQALAARAHTSGLGFGFSQFAVFSVYALAFWYGGQLMKRGEMDFAQVLKVRPHATCQLAACKTQCTMQVHASCFWTCVRKLQCKAQCILHVHTSCCLNRCQEAEIPFTLD